MALRDDMQTKVQVVLVTYLTIWVGWIRYWFKQLIIHAGLTVSVILQMSLS